ncbi:MAG: Gfo/Idh/MocA family oxidoreductase [Pseudomonadota bacterium]
MAGNELAVAVIGLGYFSQFHLAAWAAQPGARMVAVCDVDADKAQAVSDTIGVPGFSDVDALLRNCAPDLVDIVAPPWVHGDLVRTVLAKGRTIICQKPFCTSVVEAESVIAEAEAAGTRVVIHENFRFQPWYREVKDFLDEGRMGDVYQARFILRPGDGRGPDAYLSRQPSFQKMERFLVQETAIHLVDVFRYLLGPIEGVYADLRKLNPVLKGEDTGILVFDHLGGGKSLFDGNRLADHPVENKRFVMGDFALEGEAGLLAIDGDGILTFRPFDATEVQPIPLSRPMDRSLFGGGCVPALIAHVVAALQDGGEFENEAADYVTVMRVTEAAYRSAQTRCRVAMD